MQDLHSPEEPWSCQISIRLEFDQGGKKTERTKELPFGPRIGEASKGEVEIALRKAQYCNLNPGVAFQDVIDMDIQEFKQACQTEDPPPFSRNVVCIDLQGPDMVDFSFIDLPGDGRRSHQWKLFHSRNTFPMTEGRSRHKLVHGYYCARQLDDAQRAPSVSPTEARKLEKEFFKKTHPWNLSTSQDRFGTDQLISTVSYLLIGIINDSALGFRTEIAGMLQTVNAQLTSLPPAITIEPATYTLQEISSFSDNVRQYVTGLQGKEALL
ncbi:hypothetical protein BDN71DRAFT_1505469 [Pleurotus eryngii]|uniref:Dynamin stalk domain-containing protein n=1 Tax=Pleurotus eryngii TaxID=5323 RepID=A0A9P6A133_PLEER|nr:hypothetical protein BDN71DRAFT_1505469 [Pleurotus eryngii]